MGLYDREYIRERRPTPGAYGRGGLSALRMWSVNTWIIAICIAVFVIDGFKIQDVPTGLVTVEIAEIDPSVLAPGNDVEVQTLRFKRPDGRTEEKQTLCRSVIERSTGSVVGWMEVRPMGVLTRYLHFSTQLGFLRFEWWRFIGFQFLHANLSHLFFNMLGLFFFGPIVEQYLGSKRYLAFYLLCGICGAIMYLILNLAGYVAATLFGAVQIPGLLFNDPSMPLVGASAGIFGVLMAGAYLAPRTVVLVMYVIPMQLRTMAYLLVAIALVTVVFGGDNAGGQAGHLGGAIAGFYFIRRPHHLHNFFDILGRVDPTSHHYRHGGSREKGGGPSRWRSGDAGGREREIDRILDKIHEHGLGSLTDAEKRTLSESSGGR